MFHRTKHRFEALAALLDEVLNAGPAPAAPPHPHDRIVSVRIRRRAGSVIPREQCCLCPVRPTQPARPRADPIARP